MGGNAGNIKLSLHPAQALNAGPAGRHRRGVD